MLCALGVFVMNYLRTSIITKNVEISEMVCSSMECFLTADRFESQINDDNEPCNSFYEHICGNYQIEEDIPSHVDYMDTVYERKTEINKKILNYFENSKTVSQPKPGFQKIISFYESCVEETILPIPFYDQMTEELQFLGFTLKPPFFGVSLEALFSPAKILALLHATSVGEPGFLFEIYVEDRNYGRVIQFAEAKNSLLVETRYTPQLKDALSDYIRNVSTILCRITCQLFKPESNEELEQRIQDVADFLIELTKIQKKQYYEETENTENSPMNVFDLQQWTTNQLKDGEIRIKWTEFFETLYQDGRINSLIVSNKNIIFVKNKTQFQKILQLLENTKIEVFIAAMWWYKVQSLEEFFPKPLDLYRQVYEQYAYRLSRAPRSQRCLDWIWTHFGLFVNHLLATEPRSIGIREKVSTMTENIVQTQAISFYKASWADDKTIQRALEKLNNMKIYVGFTNSVLDSNFVERAYEEVEIFEARFIQTLSTLFREKKRNNFLQIFSDNFNIFDENKVRMDIVYHQHSNALEIPISILGPPLYDLGLELELEKERKRIDWESQGALGGHQTTPLALNYGSLGTHISHFVWHALDLEGREFNETGATEYWWTSSTTEKFDQFVHRFQLINNDYIKPLRACVDGERTVLENMADWTGFKIGLKAYKKSFKSGEKEMKLPKFTEFSPEKLFIVAFANSFCIKAKLYFLTNQIKRESTPPNIARVNAVVKNSKLFSKLWGCKYVQLMNPQQKYNFWN